MTVSLVLDMREVNRYSVKCNFHYKELRSSVRARILFFYLGSKASQAIPMLTFSHRTNNFWVFHGHLPAPHGTFVSQSSRSDLAPLIIYHEAFTSISKKMALYVALLFLYM